MLHIKNVEEGLKIYIALGSELRIKIIKLLIEHTELNMNELATSLGVTNGALTSHIKKLEDCGLICVISEHNGHGNQKICRVNVDKLLVDPHLVIFRTLIKPLVVNQIMLTVFINECRVMSGCFIPCVGAGKLIITNQLNAILIIIPITVRCMIPCCIQIRPRDLF